MKSYVLEPDFDWDDAAKIIHAACVQAGWWDPWPNKFDRYETAIMLVVSELSEAMEGQRKNLVDDHLKDVPMFWVELADTAIRLLDLAGALEAPTTMPEIFHTSCRVNLESRIVPEQLYYAVRQAVVPMGATKSVPCCLLAVITIADLHNIPLKDLIRRKFEYNQQREDHKKEVRENTKHGKKY